MTSIARKIINVVAVTGAAAAMGVVGATNASAQQIGSYPLAPGTGQCTANQYASYQVRADGAATGQGAKFKLLRNGVVVANTATRATGWALDLRTSNGTFPGPGYYAVCAQNTGTTNTTVTLNLRTDAEI